MVCLKGISDSYCSFFQNIYVTTGAAVCGAEKEDPNSRQVQVSFIYGEH